MENIHNTTPVTKQNPVEITISQFDIKDNNNLIVSIVNAPIGKMAIQSSFWTINQNGEKGSSIPLGHAVFTGTPEQIITNLLKASATVLSKGQSQNPDQGKKLIIPAK
jgi:hypothetical protein